LFSIAIIVLTTDATSIELEDVPAADEIDEADAILSPSINYPDIKHDSCQLI